MRLTRGWIGPPFAPDICLPKSMLRLLRLPQVMQRTGLKKTKLYELQKRGSFPMRIQITSNSVGWTEEEVNVWIAGRVAASKAVTHKVNKPTRAVWGADLAETRRVSRTIPSILPIALPRLRQYYVRRLVLYAGTFET
jgi:prophage regulatory protein